VRRASDKRRSDKHNLVNNPKNNPVNNPKNNPVNNPKNWAKYSAKNNAKRNKKIKLARLAKNLQAVQDDPTLDATLKMTPGTSASVSD